MITFPSNPKFTSPLYNENCALPILELVASIIKTGAVMLNVVGGNVSPRFRVQYIFIRFCHDENLIFHLNNLCLIMQ